jgi:hypothetical protein
MVQYAELNRPAKVGEVIRAELGGCGGNSLDFMTENGPVSGSGVDAEMVTRAIAWIEAENAKAPP